MQRRLQYLNVHWPIHLCESSQSSAAAKGRLWWLVLGLALLVFFLVSTGLLGGVR